MRLTRHRPASDSERDCMHDALIQYDKHYLSTHKSKPTLRLEIRGHLAINHLDSFDSF